MKGRGLVIAAPRSSSGKTTITLGLLRAFARQGIAIRGLKCGPDYIDPAFHAAATATPSMNLDAWAMPPSLVASLAHEAADHADLILCEGLMGLFDGVPSEAGRTGSSADIAAATGWPVVLVLDVSGQSQSAAAIALGCARFDPRITIAGVIINKVGSARHDYLIRRALSDIDLPCFGSVPRDASVTIPERHLGLVQAEETENLDRLLDHMADVIASHVDMNAIYTAARLSPHERIETAPALHPPGQRIALARDAAFSFIYPHHIDSWRKAGAEIIPFSPLADEAPDPSCDICWLPGGYPELHAAPLSQALHFKNGLIAFSQSKPVHGECGGYMTLGEIMTDAAGHDWPMLGLLGVKTSFAKRKMTLGYRDATLLHDTVLGKKGAHLRGHEFHYATIIDQGNDDAFATVIDAYGSEPKPAGSRRGYVTGSFFHAIAETNSR